MSHLAIAWLVLAQQKALVRLELAQSLSPDFEISDHRLVDLDAESEKGATELVLLGSTGQVRVFARATQDPGKLILAPTPLGATRIADSSRALVDFAHFGERAGLDLVVIGPKDTRVFPREGAGFAAEGVVLAKRATHGLRVGAPRFVDVVQDVNGDGRADLVVPSSESLRLWLGAAPAATPASPWPEFTPGATLAVEVSKSHDTDAGKLSDVLEASFSIPSIVARDVNGDGRADLLVSQGTVRAFHLQAADTTFPEVPSVRIDLSVFRDTIEKAQLRAGHTLAIGDKATYEVRDLDVDGIPDYVIAHRRKVWVFHGTSQGPQFKQPSAILKTSDDITALQLVRLDADKYPDLLLIKVQIPTIAAFVRGVFSEWEVEVTAAGYLSKEGERAGQASSPGGERRVFESTPSKRAELAVRLPSILRLIKNPESFLKRFEEIGARFRRSVWGDFDGNGVRDVVLATEDGLQVELWLSDETEEAGSRSLDGEALLAQLLFEDPERVWDVDRIAAWLGGLAERRTDALTGGKPSTAQFPLRSRTDASITSLEAADLDGDGRAELVLRYALIPSGAVVFDILRLAR
ncbi:MAG TPA: VCBS repeat-containing protein [Planctomycetota bacterium]|nr:VCBS repeat-containing protein [Planctomycetota bacterium]